MKWKLPPKIKIYEALGCIADQRIEITENEAKVYSSSRNKFYVVKYDAEKNAIMANDNGSYWVGYLGYPSIAFLMLKGIIKYNDKFTSALKDIKWKDINTQFKNDFEKTEEYIKGIMVEKGFQQEEFNAEIEQISEQIKKLNLEKLGKRIAPPQGY
jgi:hypothetical protein